ncbi:polyadenylate-binding protein rbp47 [Quercus suber]|uniref:Polyadenylate-binding protein rbp47 n=1 Tax=Quercus suber TaxID=58331 RepID=A0AAW0LWI0_QUESU
MQQHQQQQWMAMQYPAVAMAMMQQHQQQQMMMYNYMPYAAAAAHPYHQHQQQQQVHVQQQHHQNHNQGQKYQNQKQQQQQQLGSTEEAKTIWIGDLHHWMDETYLHSCFSHTAEVSSAKVIRNKQTGQSEGYGFVEFFSHEIAEKILQSYNGTVMPNTEQPFRLNWATFSAGDKRSEAGSDLSIFVGDLATDVTDTILQETFATRYPSVKGAKVVFDSNTGRSKGYGFVRFGDENERSRAVTEMNGMYCSSRPMRVGVATPKKSSGYSSQAVVLAGGHASNGVITQGSQSDGESTNTTNAEDAMQSLNGAVIGKQTVRLSWGRSPASKQWRDHSNQWNGTQNGGQGYGGYGYAVPQTQGLGMYATAAVHGAS